MDVKEAVHLRRAHRALDGRPVEEQKIIDLVETMMLSPSCNNNQPWRVIVVSDEQSLDAIRGSLPRGNAWASRSPLIFAICAKLEDDCRLADRRDYYLFSCGLAVGEMLLRATELGLIAHPIAGYGAEEIKQKLGVPEEYVLITLVICGYIGDDTSLLSEKQIASEKQRPDRKPVGENFFRGRWGNPIG